MTVADALRAAAVRLGVTSDTARLDAEVLMAHALGVTRSDLLLRHLRDAVPAGFAALVERRAGHAPVAYITGRQEFYGLEFAVTPDVLIPRGDSEVLIEIAQAAMADDPPARILDLGTGSGALLVAALCVFPEAEGYGLDRSVEALFVAIGNAQRHVNTVGGHVGPGPHEVPEHKPGRGFARFVQRDWRTRGWRDDLGTFDLVLANPPYVEDAAELASSVRAFEPAGALFAGADGLDDYRVLIPQLPALLAPAGVALVEIGAAQGPAVTAIAEGAGLVTQLHHDLANRPRVVEMRA